MMEGRAGRRLMRALMRVTAPTPSRSGTQPTCARTTIGSSSARLSFGALPTRRVGISRVGIFRVGISRVGIFRET